MRSGFSCPVGYTVTVNFDSSRLDLGWRHPSGAVSQPERGISYASSLASRKPHDYPIIQMSSYDFFPRTARAISGNRGKIAEYFSHNL